jgi:F-type H+-transporting ATPase subunit delta
VINVSIARRYARALLAASTELGRADAVLEELETMVKAMADSKDVKGLFESPGFTRQERQGFVEAFAKLARFEQPTVSFLGLLVDRGRTEHIEQIARIYRQLADEAAGRVRALVSSPKPLDAKARESLKAALAKMTGKTIQLEEKVDPTLVGGLVAKVGDRVFDGSLKTQLESIRKAALS